MLRRTPAIFWVANYFRGVKKPSGLRGENRRAGRQPPAKARYRAASTTPIPTVPIRRTGLATAHQSVLELVAGSLAQLQRAVGGQSKEKEEYGAIRFQVMSEVVPSLKLVLPLPTARAAHLTASGLPEHAPGLSSAPAKQQPSSNFCTSRYVAIPSERIPTLKKASVPQIVEFLHQTSPLRSSSDTPNTSHERSPLGSPVFNLEEVAMMLQLAATFDVRDVDLTLRVYSELERNLQVYRSAAIADDPSIRKSNETTRKKEEDASASGSGQEFLRREVPPKQPVSASAVCEVPPKQPVSASAVSNLVFYTSSIGFLEDHNLQALITLIIMPLLKQRKNAFTPRELVHIAVGLCRFQCHNETAFDVVMQQISKCCRGTSVRPAAKEVSAASSLPYVECRVASETSIAHPSQRLSADILVELVKCVALSLHRSNSLVDAITYRFLYLCEGAQVQHPKSKRIDAESPEWQPPPTAEQLHFACDVFRRMEQRNTVLEAALVSLASKRGIVLNHGGDTREEEGAEYTDFAVDLVKI